MRKAFYDRLIKKGVAVTPATFEAASSFIDQQLGYEISRYSFGRQAESRRRWQDDPQMQEALRLLRRASTPKELADPRLRGGRLAFGELNSVRSARPDAPRVAIIGAGRAGRALALALVRASVAVHVCVRRPTELPSPIECSLDPWNEVLAETDIVLLAVPDDEIGNVATAIHERSLERAVVLHTSGLRDRAALKALEGCARGLGSFHPLQTLAGDSEAAGRLHASFAVLEGDVAAVQAGRKLAATWAWRHW
jgi:hypothetical protein